MQEKNSRKADSKTKAAKGERLGKLSEKKKNHIAVEANDRFLKSGIQIKDVYGKLD